MFVLMLLSRLSSLAHKHLVLVLVFVLVALVRTGLYFYSLFIVLSGSDELRKKYSSIALQP